MGVHYISMEMSVQEKYSECKHLCSIECLAAIVIRDLNLSSEFGPIWTMDNLTTLTKVS